MSGHSHFHNIADKKARTDAMKGKIFSRLSKEITIVVKSSGSDQNSNPSLRLLISKAKEAQMPADNIKRAIDKGLGKDNSEQFIESQYETMKCGVSIVVKTLSSNNNRVVAKINEAFKRGNAQMLKPGSMSRNFDKLGIIYVNKEGLDEDMFLSDVLEAGADDVEDIEGLSIVKCQPMSYMAIYDALDKKYSIDYENSGICLYPNLSVEVNDDEDSQIQKFIDSLNELEDVQEVYDNRA